MLLWGVKTAAPLNPRRGCISVMDEGMPICRLHITVGSFGMKVPMHVQGNILSLLGLLNSMSRWDTLGLVSTWSQMSSQTMERYSNTLALQPVTTLLVLNVTVTAGNGPQQITVPNYNEQFKLRFIYLSPPIWASSKSSHCPRTSSVRTLTLVWIDPPQACNVHERKGGFSVTAEGQAQTVGYCPAMVAQPQSLVTGWNDCDLWLPVMEQYWL